MFVDGFSQHVQAYQDIYGMLSRELKWKAGDKRAIMMIAATYVMNEHAFDLKRFLRISERIKKESGLFSPLRSYQRFLVAAMLDVHFSHPEEKFLELLRLYKKLISSGFSRGSFTYLSAMVLLTGTDSSSDSDERIQRSLSIYKGMKKEHYFLTSTSDYPLAVLLSERNQPVKETISAMENFYVKLNEKGFRKGNELQFLSHVLSLDGETNPDTLIDRAATIFGKMKQSGIKVKTPHYPDIGMMALLPDGEEEVDRIEPLSRELDTGKIGQKDVNVKLAIHFIVHEKMKESNLVEAGLYTAMETMIQMAQQAAMIASITAVTAASSASSGGS
ncbi:MAG: DUF4003 domain-containing protein [Bacillaceae bacterium]|nr:DUF4003 domain-containing protein [Bacillaceae bacterium]